MYTLPTSFGPFFAQRQFSSMSFVGRKLSVLVTNCRSASLPKRQHFCSSLAILSSMTPWMALGFPGTWNMKNKPRQSRPTKWQNSASYSNLLLFWKHLSASTASRQHPPPPLQESSASCKTRTATWSLICSSAPDRVQTQSTPNREDCCLVILLVTIHSSTPFSMQKLMKLTKKISLSVFVADGNLL